MAVDKPKRTASLYDKPTDELWNQYEALHRVDPKSKVNKPEARQAKLRTHKEGLEGLVKGLAPESGNLIEAHGDEGKAKAKAQEMITQIVLRGYQADNKKRKDTELPSDEEIRQYLQQAGVQGGYDDVVRELMNHPNLRDVERLPPNLRRLLDYTINQHDIDGRKINRLREALSRVEHYEGSRKRVQKVTGTELNATAGPQDYFEAYHAHVQSQMAKYEGARPKTYTRKPHREAA